MRDIIVERLTKQQMAKKYPEQFLGLSNIQYTSNGDIDSADVVYTDKTESELRDMQFDNTGIVCYFTTADKHIFLGMSQYFV